MENTILQTQNAKRKKQPHILTQVVDPNGQKNKGWTFLLILMLGLELADLLVFIVTLNHHIVFKLYFFNFISFLTMIMFILIPVVWALFAVTPGRLDYNFKKYLFKLRIKRGKEKISKYSPTASEESVRSFTGILNYDPDTGLSKYILNDPSPLSMAKHPYQGDMGFDLVVFPKLIDEPEVITTNLWYAGKSLPAGTLKKTTMITGQSFSYIMDDVKEQLTEPNISPVRYSSLMSIWDHYKDRASTLEPIFLIHIGIPFHVRKEDSLLQMEEIRNGYEASLNTKGFDTVLIKDPEDWVMIITGMLTGKMLFRGDMIENN